MNTTSGVPQIAFERSWTPNARQGSVPRAVPRKRILVVEDDFVQADQMCATIRAMGLDPVGPAGSLAEALALANSENFHGAVLDVRLQRGLRIYPVVEVLWRRRIPFCFMTAYCESQITAMPAEAVLYKPVSPCALRSAIHSLLEA